MVPHIPFFFRFVLILVAVGTAFADPGERISLETRILQVDGPNALEAVNQVIEQDLFTIIRDFKPRVPADEKRTISLGGTSFNEAGPRGVPRLVMPAEVDAIVTTIDATVRGDIEIQGALCREKTDLGRKIVLDLRDSAEALQDNARSFEINLCWGLQSDGRVKLVASSFFVGSDESGCVSHSISAAPFAGLERGPRRRTDGLLA
jgi:hypothetical protein